MRRNIKKRNAKWIESADYSTLLQHPINPLAFNKLKNEERMDASDVSEERGILPLSIPFRFVSYCFVVFRIVLQRFALFRTNFVFF